MSSKVPKREKPKPKEGEKPAKARPFKDAAKSKAPAPAKAEVIKEDAGGKERLEEVLKQLIKCYDNDEDGQIERVEWLDTEEQRMGRIEFGIKQRKAAVAWFKDQEPTGTVKDGLYLDAKGVAMESQFGKSLISLAIEESKQKVEGAEEKAPLEAGDHGAIAEWLFENRAKRLLELMAPPPAAAAAEGGCASAPSDKPPPEYPMRISLVELKEKMAEACDFGRNILVLSCGGEEVETYLKYSGHRTLDCKCFIGEMYVGKTKTKEDVQAEMRKTLITAMGTEETLRNATPIHIRLGNSAFDLKKMCVDSGFPQDAFSASAWTPDEALKRGMIDENQRQKLLLEDEKEWKKFHVVLSSTFDLDGANEHLCAVVPHFDELAILVVNPTS